jgi:hypothetical protein
MTNVRFTLKSLTLLAFMFAVASVANAQATRTWVSGVGDDVNPCSRTAPCKTWAGAISKTAEGGEIDALDPGGFGTLTITKAITIEGTKGQGHGSILSSGSPGGITINITGGVHVADAVVNLRNLSFQGTRQGTSPGTDAIRFIGTNGRGLFIEDCVIENYSGDGIEVTRGGTTDVVIRNTSIFNCATGINVSNTAANTFMSVDRTTISGGNQGAAGTGISAGNGSRVSVINCVLSRNITVGAVALTGSELNVSDSLVDTNLDGLRANGGTLRVASNRIHTNTNGILVSAGTCESDGNNWARGNATNVNGVCTVQPKS